MILKRTTKTIKICVYVIIVFFFITNNFAAVIEESDSAAFMPKVEFDAIKDDYQMQLNKYYSDLDTKIDIAIANYIAGVNIKASEVISLPLAFWQSVTMMNGVIKPTFEYPGYDLSGSMECMDTQFGTGSQKSWQQMGWVYTNMKKSRNTGTNSIRPTVRNVKENSQSDLSNVTWDGIKTNWTELITASYLQKCDVNFYAVEVSSSNPTFRLARSLCFDTNVPYYSNLNDACTTVWARQYAYYTSYNGHGWSSFTGDTVGQSMNYSISYEGEIYKHVLNWNGEDTWEVYNPTFLKTLRTSNTSDSNSQMTANAWWEQTKEVKSYWSHYKGYLQNNNSSGYGTGLTQLLIYDKQLTPVNVAYNGTATNYKIPRIGLINNAVKGKNIYQDDKIVNQYLDNVSHNSERVTMGDGFVVGYAKEGDTIVWEPKFENLSSTTAGLINSNTEVGLMLSTGLFGDKFSAAKPLIQMKKINSVESTETIPITTNKTVKLEFKMPEDGFIYAKWFPAISEELVNQEPWQVDLDLVNCGTYKRIPA